MAADSMAASMSPYAARYARVAAGGMRRTNVTPGQAPMMASSPIAPMTLPPSDAPAFNPALAASPGAAPAAPSSPYDPMSLDSNIGKFQGAMAGGVQGYGDMVGQDFRKSVGGMLGDLNSIGGLRSGATVTSLNDLTTNYGRQIGDYAKMAAGQGAQMGQEEYDANIERKYRTDSEKRARKQSLLSGIGTVLGGVGGLILSGNPAGAMAGAKIGGAL